MPSVPIMPMWPYSPHPLIGWTSGATGVTGLRQAGPVCLGLTVSVQVDWPSIVNPGLAVAVIV
ncbi:hypothetical protein [Nocardioides alcanivorans]|uniref:hypothetical protein n=1 Tax=Nocardioides alcanivorans TaxID=2897352 RepID=UPI001F222D77|nr:hypothetical protein [Nocardioides alcanivorans]